MKQVEPVEQERQVSSRLKMKQGGLSWVTTDEPNGKRKKMALSDQLVSGSDDAWAIGNWMMMRIVQQQSTRP